MDFGSRSPSVFVIGRFDRLADKRTAGHGAADFHRLDLIAALARGVGKGLDVFWRTAEKVI